MIRTNDTKKHGNDVVLEKTHACRQKTEISNFQRATGLATDATRLRTAVIGVIRCQQRGVNVGRCESAKFQLVIPKPLTLSVKFPLHSPCPDSSEVFFPC